MAASFDIDMLFFYALFACFVVVGAQTPPHSIRLGSSLSPKTQPTWWPSPSGRFAFGFYSLGSGGGGHYQVGVWLVGESGKPDAIVWTANRNDPPVSSNATLELTHSGQLVLMRRSSSGQGTEEVIAHNATSPCSYASMLDTGNFVLHGRNTSGFTWESFSYPTNTILGGQHLSAGQGLFSNLSKTNSSSGKYHLSMQNDGNLVLYPAETLDVWFEAYWASNTVIRTGLLSQHHLYLNDTTGRMVIANDTNMEIHVIWEPSSFSSTKFIYFAVLDVDGFFRLYSHSLNSSTSRGSQTSIIWSVPKAQCEVKGFCGLNSFCTLNDDEPYCRCIPGMAPLDLDHTSAGCAKNVSQGRPSCNGGKEMDAALYEMVPAENLDWAAPAYFVANMSEAACSKACLEDCDCDAVLLKDSTCMKHKYPLKYVVRSLKEPSSAFFKVHKFDSSGSRKHRESTLRPPPAPVVMNTDKKAVILVVLISIGFAACMCLTLAVCGIVVFKYRVQSYTRLLEDKNSSLLEELTVRSFSYKKLSKATEGFREELGKGAFGKVYKGTLYRGKKVVAVKRLEKLVEDGEREFLAEVRAIGRAHHRNLVRLLGYCTDNSRRLLVYEFMSNGSLADLLFKKAVPRPEWSGRVNIALDIARGVLYLHEGCETPIIHCDIKPQNILIDSSWTAKISDFGLAKLLMPDYTRTFTLVRGTRGYMAPEWHKNIPISVKVDVYSYGIVLLEIIFCRKNMETHMSNPDEMILSAWVYKCFAANELHKFVGDEEVDKRSLERVIMVALWCIQDEPALRPSMKTVLLMLEGSTDILVPPCPVSSSA